MVLLQTLFGFPLCVCNSVMHSLDFSLSNLYFAF
jgi:hypothetical protein